MMRPVTIISLSLGAALSSAADTVAITEDTVRITLNGREVLTYRYRDTAFKPYVAELFTPSGLNVARDEVPDHPHHHGLMFAIAVDGVNFWEEREESGRQVHQRFGAVLNDASQAGFTQTLHWLGPEGAVLLVEERTLTCSAAHDDGAHILDWESRLTRPADRGEAELTGSHYFGLGIRFPEAYDDGGRFVNPTGEPGTLVRGVEYNVKAPWCVFVAGTDRAPAFSLAMLGAPANPRGDATWFTMLRPFSYLSGTLDLYSEPMTLAPGATMTLRYRVLTWDRAVDAGTVSEQYAASFGKQ